MPILLKFRFLLIVAITTLILLACNLFSNNLSTPDKLLEVTPFPSASIIDQKKFDPERMPDAPYLQTPQAVVLKMLEIAKVTKSDLVYDLGSGDGRIAIAAAQKFAAKAIGIEIDPELIRESERETKFAIAQTPNIAKQIKFIKQDLFKTDLRDATVVTLYLSENANLRVSTDVLPKLKSGTRVISYQYDFGDLPANQVEKIKVGNQEHMIYLLVLE